MNQIKSVCIVLSLSLFFLSVKAEEGGSGHYIPGSVATMIDSAPTNTGWVIEPVYYHYEGDYSGHRTIPVAGKISTGLNATVDSLALGGFYTFDNTVMGAKYTVGGFIPMVSLDVTGRLGDFVLNDSAQGLGDVTVLPAMLAWQFEKWKINAMLPVYLPTGDYETNKLANTGLNYLTIDPTVGASYSDEMGLNININAGVTFNDKNNETAYKSGSVFHLETSVQQLLPAEDGFWGIGINGYIYQQISADSGSGAAREFEGKSMGLGPVFSYIKPTSSGTFVVEAKLLHELETENRLDGNHFWIKAAWQF